MSSPADWGAIPADAPTKNPSPADWGAIPAEEPKQPTGSTGTPADWGAKPAAASPDEIHQLISQPGFDPAQYAASTGDTETGFQAREAMRNRTLPQKAAAVGQTLLQPSTYVNALKGAGKFVAGLAAAPLHTLAQGGATMNAPIAGALGMDDLQHTLENEQQTEGAEATIAAQKVEQGLRNAAHGIVGVAGELTGLNPALYGADADESLQRQRFDDEIQAAKNAQQLSQSQPLNTGAVAAVEKKVTGTPNLADVYSPEALQAQGARPVSQFYTDAAAAAGDPTNLALPLAAKIPGVAQAAGGIVQAGGKLLQIPDNIMEMIPKFRGATTGIGAIEGLVHPHVGIPVLGAVGLGKTLGWFGRAFDEQGAALRTGIPSAADATAQSAASAGQSAFGANASRFAGNTAGNVVSTALGFAPINYLMSGGDPSKFAESEAGAGVMGGVFGLAGDRQRLQDIAQYRLAQYGSQQFTDNPLWANHQQTMAKFSPQDQSRINVLRGVLNGGTGTDVLVLDGPTFAQKVGEIGGDARGQYAQQDKTIYLNADAIGKTPAQKAGAAIDTAGHETGHAVVDFLSNAGREADAQGLFASIGSALTPEQLEALTNDYHGKLLASTDTTGKTPEEIEALKQQIATENPPDKIIGENLAEITRKILNGRPVASYALPQPILERVVNAAQSWMEQRGWSPQIDPNAHLAFKAQMVREAARRMNGILYDVGKAAAGAMNEGGGSSVMNELAKARQTLQDSPPITPNMPASRAAAIQRQRDAAQKQVVELERQLGVNQPATATPDTGNPIGTQYPAQVAAKARNAAREAIVGIRNLFGGTNADAQAAIDAVNAENGTPFTNTEELLRAVLARSAKIKAGQPQAASTAAAPPITGQQFNDENGIRYRVTAANTEAPRVGDTVIDQNGKPYRVAKVWPNGSVDVAYTTSPLNSRPSSTLPAGSFQRVDIEPHVPQTPSVPNEPLPTIAVPSSQSGAAGPKTASATSAGTQVATEPALRVESKGDRFVVVDRDGTPINNTTYASEQHAQQAIARQGKGIRIGPGPGGAPDILNTIGELGGIAPKKATQEYDDMPALHKGYSAILGGSESPEDIAKLLHDEHNLGDGSVSTMWQLVQEAMDARRNTTTTQGPTEAAQSKAGQKDAENHVRELLAQVESKATAAEKNPNTKAAKERIQRAKIDAILDDIGNDPTGLHREVGPAGDVSIVGTFDPSDPRHKALSDFGGLKPRDANAIVAMQDGQGRVMHIRYRSAKSDTIAAARQEDQEVTRPVVDTGMDTRRQEYENDPATERTEGQIQHKAIIPLNTEVSSPSGRVTEQAIVLNNLLHNLQSIFEGLPVIGKVNPYGKDPTTQGKLIIQDAQAYAQNHAHGWTGDGTRPIVRFPDSGLPAHDPGYNPTVIPSDRFDIMNMAFHDARSTDALDKIDALDTARKAAEAETAPAKKAAKERQVARLQEAMKQRQEINALAAENNPRLDPFTGETNQLRAELVGAGFDLNNRLKSPFENLAPQHVLEVSDKPLAEQPGDVPSVRPTEFNINAADLGAKGLPARKAVAAGFMPATGPENEPEPTKPGEGQQPSETPPSRPVSAGASQDDTQSPVEDNGLPDQGGTPSERLMREAERAGVSVSLDTLKGVLRQDKTAMNKLRSMIQSKTGSPARFMPNDTMKDDMSNQFSWMTNEAKRRGYSGVDELNENDPAALTKMAAQWRVFHPRDEQGMLLQNDRSRGINSLLYGDQSSDTYRPLAGARSTLGDAEGFVRSGAGPSTPGVGGSRRDQELAALIDYAKSNDLIVGNPLSGPSIGGAEHDAWFDPKSQRWIKSTTGDGFSIGMIPRVTKSGGWELRNGTPLEYLESRRLQNEVFGDDVRLHGISTADGLAHVITSQPHVSGDTPTQPEIDSAMSGAGFSRMDDATYYRKADNVAVFDLHPANAFVAKDGSLLPIDAIVIHPNEELLDSLKDSQLQLLNRRPPPRVSNFMEAARMAGAH